MAAPLRLRARPAASLSELGVEESRRLLTGRVSTLEIICNEEFIWEAAVAERCGSTDNNCRPGSHSG